MHRLRWYLLGAASLLLFFAALSAGLVLRNTHGFSAREQPTEVEAFLARAASGGDSGRRAGPRESGPEIGCDPRV